MKTDFRALVENAKLQVNGTEILTEDIDVFDKFDNAVVTMEMLEMNGLDSTQVQIIEFALIEQIILEDPAMDAMMMSQQAGQQAMDDMNNFNDQVNRDNHQRFMDQSTRAAQQSHSIFSRGGSSNVNPPSPSKNNGGKKKSHFWSSKSPSTPSVYSGDGSPSKPGIFKRIWESIKRFFKAFWRIITFQFSSLNNDLDRLSDKVNELMKKKSSNGDVNAARESFKSALEAAKKLHASWVDETKPKMESLKETMEKERDSGDEKKSATALKALAELKRRMNAIDKEFLEISKGVKLGIGKFNKAKELKTITETLKTKMSSIRSNRDTTSTFLGKTTHFIKSIFRR